MDKEFAEEFGLELTEGKVEELGKQIAGIAHKFKEGKDDVMTMADEMITNGAMPDPEMIKMLETEEADMIRHLIAKKMGIQWTKDNGYGEMRFKQNYPESTDMVMNLLGKKKNKIEEAKEREISHDEYLKHGAGKGGKQWSTGAGKYKKYWTHRKEEVEIQEEVSAKEFDALKKGDTVTIEFKSSMSTGKSSFKVTAKNVVGKARVEKVTLQNIKKPNTVKFFLYKRGNKVSLAQGDMAASVVSFMKEEIEIDEKFAGWIAFYNREKYEIEPKKGEIDSLYDAKQAAIKHFRVPKSKQGLLAIKPAHEGIDIEKASMGDVIKDFKTSDAPQFKGKSDKKRKEMAIAAKLSKEENENDDPVGKKKKKSKKDVINLKPTAESSMKKFKDMMTKLKEKRFGKEEGRLNEALTPKDKEVINTFYSKETLGGKLLSTDGKSLEKHGLGGQTIAVWKNNKIVVTAVSDVKSTDTILNYMKKSIPKLNFDKKSWQEFFEEVELDESDGYEVDMAAKKIQHKWKKMSKSEKIKFLDKMDVLAGKTKVSDSDLEDILGDYGLTMEATGDKEAYQKFFQSALKKFGVKSPAELKGDKKKEFFDYVDKNWTGDHEEQTKKEQVMTKKSLKDAVYGMKKKKSKVTEAITIGGLEVGEQEFDKQARLDHAAPNLGMTYKDYQAKFETNGLEGPYQIDGGAYFWDKMASKWFSVETEDYVDEKRNAELNFRYTKGGSAGGGMLYQRSYNN